MTKLNEVMTAEEQHAVRALVAGHLRLVGARLALDVARLDYRKACENVVRLARINEREYTSTIPGVLTVGYEGHSYLVHIDGDGDYTVSLIAGHLDE